MEPIKPSRASAVADRISHAIRRGMIGDCLLSPNASLRALEDREHIWRRTQKLCHKMAFREALAKAQTEFAESIMLGFLKSKGLLEEPKEEENAGIHSDTGKSGGSGQEEKKEVVLQSAVESRS